MGKLSDGRLEATREERQTACFNMMLVDFVIIITVIGYMRNILMSSARLTRSTLALTLIRCTIRCALAQVPQLTGQRKYNYVLAAPCSHANSPN
jgi:hypothetical protein